MQDLIVRPLIAPMFVVSAFKGLTGGIGGATSYIKSKGLPMPAVLAVRFSR